MLAAFTLPASDRAATPSPVRAAPPAPPSTPPPTPRFADLLQRGQATHGVLARPAEAAPVPAGTPPQERAERGDDDTTPPPAQEAARSGGARAGAKAAPRLRESPREKPAATSPTTPPAPDAPPGGTEREAADLPKTGDTSTGVATPAAELRDWLAALKPSPTATAPGAGMQADAAGAEPAAASARLPARGGAAGVRGKADDDDGTRTAAEAGTLVAADGARLARLALTSEAAAPGERRPAPEIAPVLHDAAPNPLSGAAGAVPRGFDAGTLAPVTLPAPLHSPDFAQVLGAQVSVFARDGVQQAELHLNPADMGPISVQIELDGAQARVDFSASAAETREVIERGLPELASALREQGFTLTGGGVFQQAPDRGNGDGREQAGATSRTHGHRRGRLTDIPSRMIALPVPDGRLDLYA